MLHSDRQHNFARPKRQDAEAKPRGRKAAKSIQRGLVIGLKNLRSGANNCDGTVGLQPCRGGAFFRAPLPLLRSGPGAAEPQGTAAAFFPSLLTLL